MKITKRRSLFVACVVIAVLLLIGYLRLPYAAVHGLSDYDMLADASVLCANPSQMKLSSPQAWWIRRRLPNLSEGDAAPSISVQVKWNMLLLARVNSGQCVSSTGAEGRDSLYMWFFGYWIRVYDFSHVMA